MGTGTGVGRARRIAGLLACVAGIATFGCGEENSGGDSESVRAPRAGAAAGFEIGVDRRVELLSVLCRLAGVPPYAESISSPYARAVQEHFAPFAQHPAVAATRALMREHGISYDAPVELAAYLDDSIRPMRSLDPLPPGLDPRWKDVDLDAYLQDVRDFAAAARFDDFHRSQGDYHAAVENAIRAYLADRRVVDWFDETFGRRHNASYRVVPGLLTGGHGFSTTAKQRDGGLDVAQIVFLEGTDERCVPRPSTRSLEYLVHEFAHSYVNPIFEARAGEMRASALPLFREVEPAMRAQAYTTYPIMVNEAVVRAIQILYLRERVSVEEARRSLAEQQAQSFL